MDLFYVVKKCYIYKDFFFKKKQLNFFLVYIINFSFLTNHVQLLSKLGWDARKNESQSDTLLRKQIQNTFVLLGHEKTINYAIEHLQPFSSNTSTIALSPDIKKVN